MHAEFGNYLLVFALFMSVCLSIFPLVGTVTNKMPLVFAAKPLTILLFSSMFGSFVCLALALWVGLTSLYHLTKITQHAQGLKNKLKKLTAATVGRLVAHFGVAVLFVGVLLTSYYSVEKNVRLVSGESEIIGDYRFEMVKVEDLLVDNYQTNKATFNVYKNDSFLTKLYPEKRFYLAGKQIMTEADIDARLFRDLYVALGESLDQSGRVWSVRLYVKPFIRWIWLGALMMGIGGVIALADKRYRKIKVKNSESKMSSESEINSDKVSDVENAEPALSKDNGLQT